MEQPLFPVPQSAVPTVLLGSGPGPSPALEGAAVYTALLDPLEPAFGMRGWMLTVSDGNGTRHHFSRAGARPPLIGARLAALRALGYEPADDEPWRWQETTSLGHKHVVLFAALAVRRVQSSGEAAL